MSILVHQLEALSLTSFNLFISVATCPGINRVFSGTEFLKSVFWEYWSQLLYILGSKLLNTIFESVL